MSQPANRVIGIIRISDPRMCDASLQAGRDDSTLGSLLAGLCGNRAAATFARGHRWESPASRSRRGSRRILHADLAALCEDLQREYVALTAG